MKQIASVTINFSKATIAIIAIAIFVGYRVGNQFPMTGKSVLVTTTTQQQQTAPTQNQPTQQGRVNIDYAGEPALGNKNAKVVVVEFDDFQCPFCKRFHDQTEGQLKKDYIDTGKILFVHKDFPLPFHTEADEMQESAQCARDQGEEKFWTFRETVFSKQTDWAGKSNVFDLAKQYAAEVGLDTTKFNTCVDSAKYRSEIQQDIKEGSTAGVSGTPTFYINGLQLVGAQPYSSFKQVIDAELAG